MQELEDDIDKLFKEAATSYKLKDPGDDWQLIAAKFSEGGSFLNGRKYFALLLLLISFSAVSYMVYSLMNNKENKAVLEPYKNTSVLTSSEKTTNSAALDDQHKKVDKSMKVDDKKQLYKLQTPAPVIGQAITINKPVEQQANPGIQNHNEITIKPSLQQPKRNNTLGNSSTPKQLSTVEVKTVGTPVNSSSVLTKDHKSPQENETLNNKTTKINTTQTNQNASSDTNLNNSDKSVNTTDTSFKTSDIKTNTADTNSKKTDTITNNAVKKLSVKKELQKNKGLIIGLSAGPEWNQVKHQRTTKPGFDIGAIAGYKFNNRISLVSGIGFAKKYYYSQGKYFNLTMPGKEVVSLQGSSTIIEIPLKFTYNFLPGERSSLFGSAGFMSYLLTNEKNDYIILVNGVQMNMTNEYNKASRYVAAAIDLSAGYELQLKKNTSLRIQPYIQIPLKGIGVGSMQVMSSGIHVGATRLIPVRRHKIPSIPQ